MKLTSKILIAIGIVAFFLVLSYAFVPEVLQGKIVNQSDIAGYSGMAHEMSEWDKAHPDDPTYWTGSMFSGMPTTPITNTNGGDWTQYLYDALLTGKRPATYFFITLLGAFLLMLAFGSHWLIAVGGAVAMAFCTYNMQIINVGHNTKMQAIAFLPWALAAMVYTYRSGKWTRTLLGAALFGLAVSLQIKANHQQITYYLAIMILLYVIVDLIGRILRKEGVREFFIASALLLVTGSLGVATNANKLLPLWEYTPHSIRGGTELSGGESNVKGGLDIDYATAWSYGWDELPNMMIPDFNGGGSANDLSGKENESGKVFKKYFGQAIPELSASMLYSGEQPGTAGPMYMGAITIFLFIMGLFLYEGKEKWWLLAVTVLAILFAVGHHFRGFTKAAFAVLPLYNKFRSVSMALVILQYSLPLLGFLTLDRICKENYKRERFLRAGVISLIITGGFCAIMALFPDISGTGVIAEKTAGTLAGVTGMDIPDYVSDEFVSALTADKLSMVRHDSVTALVLILTTFLLLLWAYSPKGQTREAKAFAGTGRKWIAAAVIAMLVLVNMFAVGKRYLNAGDFTTPSDFSRQFALRDSDKEILKDKDLSYRVLDLSADSWNSSVASYRHKSIGGYSPAKLQRYQDLYAKPDNTYGPLGYDIAILKTYLGQFETSELMAETGMLSALNMRYAIGRDGKVYRNEHAFGNAWTVDSLVTASSVDEEYALTEESDLRRLAVLGPDFAAKAEGFEAADGTVTLTSYAPNELRYAAALQEGGLVVFSEIWYPGWKATVDGSPLELLRADWTLRAAYIPAGTHEIVMRFEPESYSRGRAVSLATSITLILLLLFAAGGMFIKKK